MNEPMKDAKSRRKTSASGSCLKGAFAFKSAAFGETSVIGFPFSEAAPDAILSIGTLC
ncbi:MAG: hypothetical protein ABSA57_18215 [Candidatus Acidiferrales bacterium]|jgi:hypothetical protein